MQFAVKDEKAGKQHALVPPAAVAVSVAFLTGFGLYLLPSRDPVASPEPREIPEPQVHPAPVPIRHIASDVEPKPASAAKVSAEAPASPIEATPAPSPTVTALSFDAAFPMPRQTAADYVTPADPAPPPPRTNEKAETAPAERLPVPTFAQAKTISAPAAPADEGHAPEPTLIRVAAIHDALPQSPDDPLADDPSAPTVASISAALHARRDADMGSSVSPEALDWILGRSGRDTPRTDEVLAVADPSVTPDPLPGKRVPALTRVDPQVLREFEARQQDEADDSGQALAALATVPLEERRAPHQDQAAERIVPASIAHSAYRQTPDGIEVDLPMRLGEVRAGPVTLLIAGASLDRADVVHSEFRISLATVLKVLQPKMDPALYARLAGSTSAQTLVTFNQLRAAGVAIGFGTDGDLVLG